MRKERKTFGQEFKKEAVTLVMEHGYSYAAAGRSSGIRGNLIGRWKRQLDDNASAAFPGKGKRTVDQQRIHDLETENRRLRMEKEILKKATVRSMGRCNTLYSGKEKRSVIHGKKGKAWPHRRAESRAVGTMEEGRIA